MVWNADKFAQLLKGMNAEGGKEKRIAHSNGWTKDFPDVETESAAYSVRLVGSYASPMGVCFTSRGTGIDTLIICDGNHGVTNTTARQLSIFARGLFGTRFNAYDTGKPFAESMGGFNVERTPRAAQFADTPTKTRRALKNTGYSAFFEMYSDILTEINNGLKSWNRVK